MPIPYFRTSTTAACLFNVFLLLLANSYLSAQTITSVTPNSAPAGSTVNVQITGTGVNFNSGTAVVYLRPATGPNITSWNTTVSSGTTMTAVLNIPSSATLGDYDIQAGNMTNWTPAMFAVTGSANVGSITGKVYHDVNENCSQGAGEPDLSGYVVHVTPGNYYAMTNAAGEYNALVPPGTYSVDVQPPPYYNRLCPAAPITAIVTGTGSVTSGNDFAMDPDSVYDGGIACGAIEFRPGFNTIITVTVTNIGVLPMTGTASLVLDSNLTYLSSNPSGTTSGDTVSWNITTPIPAGGVQNYTVTVNLPTTVALGTIITNTALLDLDSMDYDPESNVFQCVHTVIGSYDPNDKTVWDQDMNLADPGIDPNDSILIYRIRFQNTGTASAINIFIRDTLDAQLDPGTMRMLGTSHLPYTMTMNGDGNVEWRFPNINLPDSNSNEPASHGFVLFEIKPRPGFTTGMSILNKASIYFDFNDPIVTNETSTSIIVSREDPLEPSFVKVYPNPASERLLVELECTAAEGIRCQLLDPMGKAVREVAVPCQGGIQKLEVPVQGLSTGVYILKTSLGERSTAHKVMITK